LCIIFWSCVICSLHALTWSSWIYKEHFSGVLFSFLVFCPAESSCHDISIFPVMSLQLWKTVSLYQCSPFFHWTLKPSPDSKRGKVQDSFHLFLISYGVTKLWFTFYAYLLKLIQEGG
jgi:hypothetical protein